VGEGAWCSLVPLRPNIGPHKTIPPIYIESEAGLVGPRDEIRDYEVCDGGGRPARGDDFRKDAEPHELGRERPAAASRASRELLNKPHPGAGS
jgi:hypothetical protein